MNIITISRKGEKNGDFDCTLPDSGGVFSSYWGPNHNWRPSTAKGRVGKFFPRPCYFPTFPHKPNRVGTVNLVFVCLQT